MFGLCSGDPIITTLRSVFHANIVEIPEERIRPLSLVAKIGSSKTSFRGVLSAALKAPTNYSDPPINESTMANVSGTKSRQVDAKVGLQILGNFLSGFGVSPIGIDAAFTGATKVSFSFNKVIRYWIDDDVLGSELTGSVLDKANPGAAIFFQPGGKYTCFIIDSTITSSDFTISVDQSSGGNFQIKLPAIQQIVQNAQANMSVASSSSTSISFTGQRQLAFAFSCISAQLDSDGRILALQPGGDLPSIEGILATGDSTGSGELFVRRPAHALLTRVPVMLDAEFMPAAQPVKKAARRSRQR
jgi:hypothetical protein